MDLLDFLMDSMRNLCCGHNYCFFVAFVILFVGISFMVPSVILLDGRSLSEFLSIYGVFHWVIEKLWCLQCVLVVLMFHSLDCHFGFSYRVFNSQRFLKTN